MKLSNLITLKRFLPFLLILILVGFVSASVLIFHFVLVKRERNIEFENAVQLRTIQISNTMSLIITETRDIVMFHRMGSKRQFDGSLKKLNALIPVLDKRYKILNDIVENHPAQAKNIYSRQKELYFHWIHILQPILLRLTEYHNIVAGKILITPLVKQMEQLEKGYYSPSAIKEKKKQIDALDSLYRRYDAAYIIGSVIGFGGLAGVLFLILTREYILKDDAERYGSMFKENSAPILLVDAETGVIKEVSKSALAFYGYAYNELVGANVEKLNTVMPSEEQKEVRRRIIKGEIKYVLFKHRLKNGEIKDVEFFLTPITIKGRSHIVGIINDITDKKMLEDRLEESEELFSTVAEESLSGLVLYNEKIIYANWCVFDMLGYSREELYGIYIWDLFSEDSKEMVKQSVLRRLNGDKFDGSYTLEAIPKDKRRLLLSIHSTTVIYKGKPVGLASFIDVTEIKKLEEELEHEKNKFKELSEIDPLTGIFNRRRFESSLSDYMKVAQRYERPLSLIMFDIDHFKKINDTYGHQAGDEVLKDVCNLVKPILRNSDTFARVGGEEFMIICTETDVSAAKNIAEKIRSSAEAHAFNLPDRVTLTLGATEYRQGIGLDDFVRNADQAMYKGKIDGRNRVEVYQA
ncbi:MAG: sensor domain-containing diguanylate cyclase [Candidatus Acidulodesulfobacterium ferriphilum]|uniref:Sensor domain-containing diguanylate cyclase n=1 Tax=Candidatus Acidulodesulfobacterium ferriphilum TaxID=2597223 RepID=A0A519BBL6_9DELT|nr:MAG: sensor domain-containing diguanylate cyclase [Candidatus Acidulodesulfobacterium ferriphilum]